MKVDRKPKLNSFLVPALFICISSSGCALKEAAKKVIGNSTQTLEQEARFNGVSRSYNCSYQDCFEAVAAMARQKESDKPWVKIEEPNEGDFEILMSDLYSNPPYIVVVGVKGNIDTTEVGIFFTRVSKEAIRVSISSLASTAKRTVSDSVFSELSQRFEEVANP